MRSRFAWPALLLIATLGAACAKRLPTPATGPPAPAGEKEPGSPDTAPSAPGAAQTPEPVEQPKPKLSELCRHHAPEEEAKLDAARRRLQSTVCGANLWLDSLFGGEPDVQNARAVSGRLELSSIYTEADGNSPKIRLRANYNLPTLKRRFNLFLGREDPQEAVEDRREPFAIRSSVFGLETEERWLAGLGYSAPGRYADKLDFRLGVRLQNESRIFGQVRYRRNFFIGYRSAARFRETVFWENREAGFGSTTSLDFDRVLSKVLLLRWGNVGTVSGAVDGLAWRSSLLLYRNLPGARAISGELFVRGESRADVPLREYGVRAIYRRSVFRPWLFGEVIGGYTFPRKELVDRREGSGVIGFGIDLLFGEDPY